MKEKGDKKMKKYVMPEIQVISRNDLDIICASELLFPIIPLSGKVVASAEEEEA